MKKKILIAYESMFIGGSTTSLLSLLNSIDYDKFDVYLQLRKDKGELIDFVSPNVKILPMATRNFPFIVKLFIGFFSGTLIYAFLYNLLHKKKGFNSEILGKCQVKYFTKKDKTHYDYAVGFMEGWADKYVAYNVNAAKKYGWLHSTLGNVTSSKKLAMDWMRRMDNIILVSESVKNDFARELPELSSNAMVIENLLDDDIVKMQSKIKLEDEDFKKIEKDNRFKICTVCRIDFYVKGIDRILSAVKILKNKGYDFCWYIIGGGKEFPKLRDQIMEKELGDFLYAFGKKLNPYPYVSCADVFVLPSRVEGKPMSVTEAMILGIPPIVTRYFSASEQIENGKTGLIGENTDDSIVCLLEKCISDRKIVDKMKINLSQRSFGNKEYYNSIEVTLFK